MRKNEKFFGELAVQEARVQQIKSDVQFLKELSMDVQEAYIQLAVVNKLPVGLMPNEDIYVFTPDDCFRYQKQGAVIKSIPTLTDQFSGRGTIKEGLEFIAELADRRKKERQGTLIPALYFDRESKATARAWLQERDFKFLKTDILHVPKYGNVGLDNYVRLP